MGMSISHLLLLALIILIVFGAGRLPQVMGDIAKGLKSFKDNFKDNDDQQK